MITPVNTNGASNGAVIGVAERTVSVTNGGGATRSARAAYNIHGTGDLVPAAGPDQITLTAD